MLFMYILLYYMTWVIYIQRWSVLEDALEDQGVGAGGR